MDRIFTKLGDDFFEWYPITTNKIIQIYEEFLNTLRSRGYRYQISKRESIITIGHPNYLDGLCVVDLTSKRPQFHLSSTKPSVIQIHEILKWGLRRELLVKWQHENFYQEHPKIPQLNKIPSEQFDDIRMGMKIPNSVIDKTSEYLFAPQSLNTPFVNITFDPSSNSKQYEKWILDQFMGPIDFLEINNETTLRVHYPETNYPSDWHTLNDLSLARFQLKQFEVQETFILSALLKLQQAPAWRKAIETAETPKQPDESLSTYPNMSRLLPHTNQKFKNDWSSLSDEEKEIWEIIVSMIKKGETRQRIGYKLGLDPTAISKRLRANDGRLNLNMTMKEVRGHLS